MTALIETTGKVLADLVRAIETIEDVQAMPDGSQGHPSESFFVGGNIGRKVIDLARCHANVGRQAVVLVQKMESHPDIPTGSFGVVRHVSASANDETVISVQFNGHAEVHELLEDEFCRYFRCIDLSTKNAYPELFNREAVDAARATEAEFQFDQWNFPLLVKDVGEWEYGGNVQWRSVFLHTDGDSIRVIFKVTFRMGSWEVSDVTCYGTDDEVIGSPS